MIIGSRVSIHFSRENSTNWGTSKTTRGSSSWRAGWKEHFLQRYIQFREGEGGHRGGEGGEDEDRSGDDRTVADSRQQVGDLPYVLPFDQFSGSGIHFGGMV